uniref:D-lactate dehydrogenase n=1 Tax=Solanum tuberosum TaxID=4113 RepID=M1AGJ2_SOLTU
MDVVVEPGIGWMELNEYLESYGLFFPLDPGPGATIGGMCATRCSGSLAVRYGTMRDNVINLKVVLADGEVMKTASRARKSAAGLVFSKYANRKHRHLLCKDNAVCFHCFPLVSLGNLSNKNSTNFNEEGRLKELASSQLR